MSGPPADAVVEVINGLAWPAVFAGLLIFLARHRRALATWFRDYAEERRIRLRAPGFEFEGYGPERAERAELTADVRTVLEIVPESREPIRSAVERFLEDARRLPAQTGGSFGGRVRQLANRALELVPDGAVNATVVLHLLDAKLPTFTWTGDPVAAALLGQATEDEWNQDPLEVFTAAAQYIRSTTRHRVRAGEPFDQETLSEWQALSRQATVAANVHYLVQN